MRKQWRTSLNTFLGIGSKAAPQFGETKEGVPRVAVFIEVDEWFEGIRFLNETGQISVGPRQEFILLSDTLGVSALVEMLAYDASAVNLTDNTVLGPWYVPDSPERAKGATMLDDPDKLLPGANLSGLHSSTRLWGAARSASCAAHSFERGYNRDARFGRIQRSEQHHRAQTEC